MIDADKSAVRCSRMWWKLGGLLERYAYDRAQKGSHHETVLQIARAADICFWQATGEMDSISLADVIGKGDKP